MYYIGLDWGQRKIGVAFGDDETKQAFGFGVIENNEQVNEALDLLATEYETDTFVLGLSGHEGQNDNVVDIESFAKNLAEETEKKIIFAPEMMSTKQAQQNLRDAGKANTDGADDIEAARIILQGFLDTL